VLYLDGRYLPLEEGRVSVLDRGFVFGDGVYEVVKVQNGRLVWAAEHLARLRGSLAALGIPTVSEQHPFEHILPELIRASSLESGIVYIQVTRGSASRGFEFPEDPHPTVLAYSQAMQFATPGKIRVGIRAHAVRDFRWGRCDIKCLNLLAAILAKQEARGAGAEEVLWLDPDGIVREGGSCNLFAVIHGVLRTHPAGPSVLAGVTRGKVLEMAALLGVEVREEPFSLEEMIASGNAFLTACTRDILPVVTVDGRDVGNGVPGPETLRLADALRAELAVEAGLPSPAALAG
jgi:D-alanine transaminase